MRLVLDRPGLPVLLASCSSGPGLPGAVGPKTVTAERPCCAPPPAGYCYREIPFADTEDFDARLEGYLVDGMSAIRIVMEAPKPDWRPRMIAWLKAYEAGGKVRSPSSKEGPNQNTWLAGIAQAPTEARQVLEGLLDRVDRLAGSKAAWWGNELQRHKRIVLLRPYVLDAERDPNRGGNYVISLYNGQYE